jgi:shikimate kinase
MAHLKEISTVVYLYLEYEALANRLGDLTKRGVVLKPGFTLRDLYNERSPLYEKYADFTVDADKGTPQAVMREIVRKLNIENRV